MAILVSALVKFAVKCCKQAGTNFQSSQVTVASAKTASYAERLVPAYLLSIAQTTPPTRITRHLPTKRGEVCRYRSLLATTKCGEVGWSRSCDDAFDPGGNGRCDVG